MVNGLHLYSAFIQSAVQFMPLIHPFTHTFTHQQRLAAMQGTNQLVRSNWGLGVLHKDTSTRSGWDQTGNPPTARRLLLPPEPYCPLLCCNSFFENPSISKWLFVLTQNPSNSEGTHIVGQWMCGSGSWWTGHFRLWDNLFSVISL